MEIRTQLKTVKITSNIFAVYPRHFVLFCPMQNQAKFLLIFNSSMIIGFTLFLDAREILAYSVRNKECQPSQALRAKPNV